MNDEGDDCVCRAISCFVVLALISTFIGGENVLMRIVVFEKFVCKTNLLILKRKERLNTHRDQKGNEAIVGLVLMMVHREISKR